MRKLFFTCNLFFSILVHVSCESQPVVKTGLDNIYDFPDLFKGKRIGIITNHTAYNSKNEHIIDVIQKFSKAELKVLFGPEHGIKGKEAAGLKIDDKIDPLSNIPIYSLYGKTRKPTTEMLKDIDLLIFDIQDIGARYYTYMSTMSLAMEAAAENNISFVVLDRPNPINGIDLEGNILDKNYASFVGLHPIPVRHGMTAGELAKMINEEGWLNNAIQVDLKIIPMTNWKRDMWYDQTGLIWRAPSPNIPDLDVATVYPGTCLFEGTNISEGRGTYQPFLRIGAPWFSSNQFSTINKIINEPGVLFGPIIFVPKSIPEMSPNPKYKDIQVTGISLSITNRTNFKPYLIGIELVNYFYHTNKNNFKWREKHFDRLCGTSKIREFIISGKDIDYIKEWLNKDLESFVLTRNKYLLY